MTDWFDRWLYRKVRDMWDNSEKYDKFKLPELKMATMGVQASTLSRGSAEGEDRISFELTSAVGGRILNVRRYDERKDRHDNTTYVIPTGEDVGTRVAKIVNLELLK